MSIICSHIIKRLKIASILSYRIIFNLPIPFPFICENSRQSSGDNAVMHTKTNVLERVGLGRLNLFNFEFDKYNQRK